MMKLNSSPASPFARKVRIAAAELGLSDKIELVATTVMPGNVNEPYSKSVNPLRKLPALTLEDGTVIVDSYVIAEYLDEIGGGKLMPASGIERWKVKTEHSILQGMLDAMLLVRYEKLLRPEPLRWDVWIDDQWERAWQGLAYFAGREDILNRPVDLSQIGLFSVLTYADFRYADCGWREAYPTLKAFYDRVAKRPAFAAEITA